MATSGLQNGSETRSVVSLPAAQSLSIPFPPVVVPLLVSHPVLMATCGLRKISARSVGSLPAAQSLSIPFPPVVALFTASHLVLMATYGLQNVVAIRSDGSIYQDFQLDLPSFLFPELREVILPWIRRLILDSVAVHPQVLLTHITKEIQYGLI